MNRTTAVLAWELCQDVLQQESKLADPEGAALAVREFVESQFPSIKAARLKDDFERWLRAEVMKRTGEFDGLRLALFEKEEANRHFRKLIRPTAKSHRDQAVANNRWLRELSKAVEQLRGMPDTLAEWQAETGEVYPAVEVFDPPPMPPLVMRALAVERNGMEEGRDAEDFDAALAQLGFRWDRDQGVYIAG